MGTTKPEAADNDTEQPHQIVALTKPEVEAVVEAFRQLADHHETRAKAGTYRSSFHEMTVNHLSKTAKQFADAVRKVEVKLSEDEDPDEAILELKLHTLHVDQRETMHDVLQQVAVDIDNNTDKTYFSSGAYSGDLRLTHLLEEAGTALRETDYWRTNGFGH